MIRDDRRKAGMAVVLLMGLGAPAFAEPLTWERCVQEASTNNAELRTARANLDAATARARGAYAGNFPQLSAGASRTDTSGSATTDTTTYSTSLTLTQNLFAGFQDAGKIEQGAANREASAAAYAIARAKLSQDLKVAFASLRYAQDNVVLTDSIARRLRDNLRLVELRFEGGRENKGSYLFTKAALAQAQLDHLQARQAAASAQAQLARVLGRSEPGELEVTGPVPVREPGTTPDFAPLVQQAPEYQQASAQLRSVAADVTIARSGFYPSLNLSGTSAREGSEWTPDADRRTVGLNLAIPLFSGGRDYYATQSAASSVEATSANRDTVARQLLTRLRQAWAAYVEAEQKLKVDREFLEAATLRADIARLRYNNGLTSFDEWDRIETDLVQRQKAHLQSQRDRVSAEAAWEQILGQGVIP